MTLDLDLTAMTAIESATWKRPGPSHFGNRMQAGSLDRPVVSPAAGTGTVGTAAPVASAGGSNSRTMSMTPLEPRERGGLNGFGFTLTFEDQPASVPPEDAGGHPHPSLEADHSVNVEGQAAHWHTATANSGHETVSAARDGNKAVGASGTSANNSEPINPHCRKPQTCRWAHGSASCWECNLAHERAKAERRAA